MEHPATGEHLSNRCFHLAAVGEFIHRPIHKLTPSQHATIMLATKCYCALVEKVTHPPLPVNALFIQNLCHPHRKPWVTHQENRYNTMNLKIDGIHWKSILSPL